jgi:hypothetical protein
MYSNTAAVIRPDLNDFVLEGALNRADLIGEKCLAVLGSDTQSGQYPIVRLATGSQFDDDAGKRASGGAYPRVTRSYDQSTFDTIDRGLEEAIDDVDAANLSRWLDLESTAAVMTQGQVALGHEVRVAAAMQSATTFTATAASVALTETLIGTCNYPKDIQAALRRLAAKGIAGTHAVMSWTLWNQMIRSTLFQNYMRGNRPSDTVIMYDEGQVASVLRLVGILVGKAQYNSAAKGKNASLTDVWNNTYYGVAAIAGGGTVVGGNVTGVASLSGVGRTIVWNKIGGIYVTETYRDERANSDIVRVKQNTAEKIFNPKAQELITTSYSAS